MAKIEKIILAVICIISAGLMVWAAWTDSAINDEIAHIPAGYDYIRYDTYNLNPEHPPLVKALALIPALFLQPNFPTTTVTATTSPDNEWAVGEKFLYGNGNNADTIIRLARLVPIALTLLTIIYIYFLSRLLMNRWWSFVPTLLFALDPTILANGHYVTTDLGATLGIVAATYYFIKHLKTRSRKSLWLAGISFGIAQLLKFSSIILIPFFLIIDLVWRIQSPNSLRNNLEKKDVKDATFIFLIGYALVYIVYAILIIHYPSSQQVSDTIAALQDRLGGVSGLGTFAVWMAGNPLLRPFAQYLLGILIVSSHVSGGVFTYAFGKVSLGAGLWYFPAIFLLKEPIPTLIIILSAAIVGSVYFIKNFILPKYRRSINAASYQKAFMVFAMLTFIIIYWCVSITSPLDHGIRYIIPTFPFIYILATYIWSVVLEPHPVSRDIKHSMSTYVIIGGLLVWLSIETIMTAPYFLSYYNGLAGGTWNGYHWATDSNYDWGQDLLRFQSFMNQHPEISKIAVGFVGRGDIQYYLGNRAVIWSSAQGNPANAGIHWFAISIDALELATQPVETDVTRNASDTYTWLTALRPSSPGMGSLPQPDYRIGTTILVYHL